MTAQGKRIIIGVAATALLLLAAPHAFAVTHEQTKACESKEDASPDLRIASCTAVIDAAMNNAQ